MHDAPLYCTTIDLGDRLAAEITISEVPPISPPLSGAEWPVEIDYPRVQLTITLTPAVNQPWFAGSSKRRGDHLHPALVAPDVTVLDRALERDGQWSELSHTVRRTVVATGPSLAATVEALRLRAEGEIAALAAHVARRLQRLAQRERTLDSARSK